MRVFVTGAAGQLGVDLQRAFADHDVIAASRAELDIAQRDAVFQVVGEARPDVVISSGAWTAVDACEDDPDRAFAVNSLGVRHLRRAADSVGARLVHVSTDYVFDGTKPTPYVEWDAPNPMSVYGRSKLGGELEAGPDACIVRTSWVCSPHGKNMVATILRLAAEHDTLTFVDDQHGCPTFTADLAEAIRDLTVGRHSGLFHVTNQGPTTWFQFARDVLSAAGHDPDRVRPCATADLDPPRPAPRPANSVLDNAALRGSGLALLPDHHDALERCVKEMLP